MSHTRTIIALSLVGLTSCSLIAKGKASLGGGSSANPTTSAPVANVPQVKSDDSDPPHVRTALDRLDHMQQLIASKDFGPYARESREFQATFLFHEGWQGEKKHDAMKQRLDALDAAAFKAFGGRLYEVVGNGKRETTGVDPDAVDAAEQMVDACQGAAKMSTTGEGEASAALQVKVTAYEKAIARVKKIDAKAFRYYGDAKKSGMIDVPTRLLECEADLVGVVARFADEYAPEVAGTAAVEKGCGVIEWLADGVQIGSGTFAGYTRTAGGNSFVAKVECNKVPKADRYPGALADAVKEFKEHIEKKNVVIVTDGKPYVEANDEDLHLYRYQKLLAYAKDFELSSNPCGSLKLFCEAGGSRGAAAYNQLEHHLDRAAVHAGTDPERCKAHLKQAKAEADGFEQLHTDLVKRKEWVTGATYKTKKGAELSEKDFISSFAEKGKLADDRLLEKYCAKPAAVATPPAAAAPAKPATSAKRAK